MDQEYDLELLLGLDGASYEAAAGYVIAFTVRQTEKTPERPHGIDYALVFCPKLGGKPYVKFDNAHRVNHRGGQHVQKPQAFDHWHHTETDPGRPYQFTTSAQLLENFWREVKRVMNEKGIPNDL